MKTEFPVITYACLVENQNKSKESVASLLRGYCYQRIGPAFVPDDRHEGIEIKPVALGPKFFVSLIEGENAMLKRAFHEVPKLVSAILLLQSNDGYVFVFFDIEAPDCGEGLCRFLAPLARTESEQNFVEALVIASQSAKELNRLWIKGGRRYYPLTDKETFECLYPKEATLAGTEPESVTAVQNRAAE